MSDSARTPIEPSDGFRPVLSGHNSGPVDLADEKHYSVIEIAKLWALSEKTVRRIFEREPGVIRWSREETVAQTRISYVARPRNGSSSRTS